MRSVAQQARASSAAVLRARRRWSRGAAQQAPRSRHERSARRPEGRACTTPARRRATWSSSRACRSPRASSIRRRRPAIRDAAGARRRRRRAAPPPIPPRRRRSIRSRPTGSASPTPTSRSAARTSSSATSTASTPTTSSARTSRSCCASVVCPGGQGDVSVYGNLLFMSVEQTRGRLDCGTQGVPTRGQHRALPRRPHLRHHRPQQAEAGRGGPDLPRLAHAHAGDRSEGQGEPLRLRIGHRRRCARRRSSPAAPAEDPKEDPNTALFSIDVIKVPLGRAAEGGDRQPAAHLRRREDRHHRRACGRAATTAPGTQTHARHQSVPRHHGVPGDRPRGRRLLGQRHPARHLAIRCTRSGSTT